MATVQSGRITGCVWPALIIGVISVFRSLMAEGMKECDNLLVKVAPPGGRQTNLLTEDVVRRTDDETLSSRWRSSWFVGLMSFGLISFSECSCLFSLSPSQTMSWSWTATSCPTGRRALAGPPEAWTVRSRHSLKSDTSSSSSCSARCKQVCFSSIVLRLSETLHWKNKSYKLVDNVWSKCSVLTQIVVINWLLWSYSVASSKLRYERALRCQDGWTSLSFVETRRHHQTASAVLTHWSQSHVVGSNSVSNAENPPWWLWSSHCGHFI